MYPGKKQEDHGDYADKYPSHRNVSEPDAFKKVHGDMKHKGKEAEKSDGASEPGASLFVCRTAQAIQETHGCDW